MKLTQIGVIVIPFGELPMRIALLALFVVTSPIMADDTLITRYIEAGKKQRDEDLNSLDYQLKKEKEKEKELKKTAKRNPKELKQSQDRIETIDAAIKETKQAEYIAPKLRPDLNVGDVGIVFPNGGIVGVNDYAKATIQFEVIRIIDEKSAIVRFAAKLHWLNTNTTGMIDDRRYPLDKFIHVKGTRMYVGKTILEIDEFIPPKK